VSERAASSAKELLAVLGKGQAASASFVALSRGVGFAALAMKGYSMALKGLEDWTKRSAAAMKMIEQSSRNWATIMGKATMSERLRAAVADEQMKKARYEELGGDQGGGGDWAEAYGGVGNWLKKQLGLTTARQDYAAAVEELDGAKKIRLKLESWAGGGAQAASLGGFSAVHTAIQDSIFQSENLSLMRQQLAALNGINSNTAKNVQKAVEK
jgi:hypothetical protein